MKKRILSIVLTLCMVLMLCPVTAFADDSYTVTFKFDHGTLHLGDAETTTTTSPYTISVPGGSVYCSLGTVTDCSPYEFVGWKETDSGTVYDSYAEITVLGDVTYEAVYEVDGSLAVTIEGFEVGKTPGNLKYTVDSTIPGVKFLESHIWHVSWEQYVFNGADYVWEPMTENEAFRAGTRYRCVIPLSNHGLELAPAVTVNGNTPESCCIATFHGRPAIHIDCELGTPPEPVYYLDVTVDGFEVGKTPKDITFSFDSTLPDDTFSEEDIQLIMWEKFKENPNDPGHWIEIADTEAFQADTRYRPGIYLDNKGLDTAPAVTVNGKTPEICYIVFNNGVSTALVTACEFDAPALQYEITYDGGDSEGSIPAGVKAYGKDFTLSGETFTREGFVQTGWHDEFGKFYELGGTYTLEEDMTFYPVWDEILTMTAPFTTTVALGDAGEPGETAFELALINGWGEALTDDNVMVTAAVTTDGAGDYAGTMTITGSERTLWSMLSEDAFVRQVDAGEEGWVYDDTVWGLYMTQIAAYSMDDAAADYALLVVPAVLDDEGNYMIDWDSIDWENLQSEDMHFTNTYSAHVYELKHDETSHWDECECGDVQNKELHKYGDWKVTEEATETATGEKEHTCTVCGYTEKAEIAKLAAKPTSPQTGDNSHMVLWIVLLFVSGAGVIGTTVYGKKKRAK